MTENDRIFHFQVIEDRNRIVAKHPCRIIDRRLARPSGAAIVVGNHLVVPRKLGDLEELPNLPVAGRLTEKDEWLSLALDVVVNFIVSDLYRWHLALQVLAGC